MRRLAGSVATLESTTTPVLDLEEERDLERERAMAKTIKLRKQTFGKKCMVGEM